MGKIATKFQGKKKELRIMILGLDSAGKTTILYRLKTAETIHSEPTVGLNVESLDYKEFTLMLWDLGGQDNLRTYWRHYYSGTQVGMSGNEIGNVNEIQFRASSSSWIVQTWIGSRTLESSCAK